MFSANTILKDGVLNKRLREEGYVVIAALDKSLIRSLIDVWNLLDKSKLNGFHTTHFLNDRKAKSYIHHTICEAVTPVINKISNNYQAVFANFMVKAAEGESRVPLHADWSYLDEKKYVGLSMWIPLTDTDGQNGCLAVIPGSHRLSYHIRGPRIPQWDVPCNFELIKAMGRPLLVKSGEVVIYDHRLLHYSDSNTSGMVRPAVNVSLVPKGIALYHYTIPEGETDVHAYAVEQPEFFLEYDNFGVPDRGRLLWKRPNDCPLLNESYRSFISDEMGGGKGLTGRMWRWLKSAKTVFSAGV